jgi:phosphoenolpyruvate synthase/pyruvate phosphate dikinase
VAFTAIPVTGDDEVVIEATSGLGDIGLMDIVR